MTRTERLLDVVALLLHAQRPLSFAQVRAAFPGEYEGSLETAERKFERDKSELLELGLPLTFQPGTSEKPGGYVLDREAYYLPDPGLSPEEVALLYAAGSAALASGAFPGRQELAHALRKLGFLSDALEDGPRVRVELAAGPRADGLAARLDVLWTATAARKWVQLDYFSPATRTQTQRRVDPWALVLRRGQWALVGFCHLRQAPRTFLVHRIRAVSPNPSRARAPDFEPPADFKVEAHVGQWPWQHALHAPVEVTLTVGGALAAHAGALFPGCAVDSTPMGTRVTVRTTHLDGLLRTVLSLGAEVAVAAPREAQQRLEDLARAIATRHEEAPPA